MFNIMNIDCTMNRPLDFSTYQGSIWCFELIQQKQNMNSIKNLFYVHLHKDSANFGFNQRDALCRIFVGISR